MIMWPCYQEHDHVTMLLGLWPGFRWSSHDSDYLPTLGGHTSFSVVIVCGAKIGRNSYKCIWFTHSKCEAHRIMKEVTIKWHKNYFHKTIYLKLQHCAAASKTMSPCCCKHGHVTNTHDLHMSLRAWFLDQIWLRCSWFYEIHRN